MIDNQVTDEKKVRQGKRFYSIAAAGEGEEGCCWLDYMVDLPIHFTSDKGV